MARKSKPMPEPEHIDFCKAVAEYGEVVRERRKTMQTLCSLTNQLVGNERDIAGVEKLFGGKE